MEYGLESFAILLLAFSLFLGNLDEDIYQVRYENHKSQDNTCSSEWKSLTKIGIQKNGASLFMLCMYSIISMKYFPAARLDGYYLLLKPASSPYCHSRFIFHVRIWKH